MQKLVFINGSGNEIDLTSGNFGITNWAGLSNVPLNIQTQQVPFEDGAVFLDALMEQREIEVTVAIYDGNNLELRYQKKRELISALNPKLGEGTLIYTNDYLSRQIKAVPQIPLFENKNSNDAGTLKASVAFTCCSPYWEDLEESEVTINGLTNIKNNGDIPTQVEIIIPPYTENPLIINQRNQKKIKFNEDYEGQITVNTNIGRKSVIGEQTAFQRYLGSGDLRFLGYGDGKVIFIGPTTYIEDYYTGKTINLDMTTYFDDDEILDMTYGNGLYVAVTWQGYIKTSSDGIVWTERIDIGGHNYNARKVIYAGGKFIAIGSRAYISNDGITWTTPTTQPSFGVYDICYGNGLYVAVGYGAIGEIGEGGKIATSTDGDVWTVVDFEGTPQFDGVAYGNGKYIAIAGLVKYASEDGVTWNDVSSYLDFNCNAIAFGNDVFVITGYREVAVSANGEEWNIINVEDYVGRDIPHIVFSGNTFTILSLAETTATSNDGITWQKHSEPLGFGGCICYGNGLFVCGIENGIIHISKDGENWEETETGLNINYITERIIFANNMFLACLNNNGVTNYRSIAYSYNGKDWFLSDDITEFVYVTYGNGKFVAVRLGKSYTSNDGIHWQEHSASIINVVYSITYGKGLFVVAGSSFYYSADGINWNSSPQPISSTYIRDIAFGNGVFVALGERSSVNSFVTSNDGIHWVDTTVNYYTGQRIIFANNMFISISSGGEIITSFDGITWENLSSGTSENLIDITFGKNKFLVLSSNALFDSYATDVENLISKLSSDSDMTFSLDVGDNNVLFTSDNFSKAILKYRQKYIGV